MNEKNLVDAETIASMFDVTPAYIRILAKRGVFKVRATRYTHRKGRPAQLFDINEVVEAWEQRSKPTIVEK